MNQLIKKFWPNELKGTKSATMNIFRFFFLFSF